MLRIRLTRTGKKGQPSYRIVVAEHTAPIKSQFVEVIGHYNLAANPRELVVDQDRVKHWISVGAKPTDTVATILKGLGMDGMDQYIGRRDLARKKKKASEEEESGGGGGATVTEEAPAEEPKEEAKAEEPAPQEEKKEEAPAEEEPKEEAPAAEEKAEEPPAEEEKSDS